ncbi:MAG: LamG domain-containing protein [Candidatus Cloacimonetes bacterium]|nr:LamG domain-containing protein [Candidatus Cloacimonadota bacterium]
MGRINMIIVMLVIIVVGNSFSSLQRNAENMSEAMNEYYREFQVKSMGAFALNYGIQKLQTGDVLVGDQEVVWYTPNFNLYDTNIDSIRFIPGVGDTIKVLPYVQGTYQGQTLNRESSATLGFHIAQPEEQFAYYMLDDAIGAVASDSSGMGYNGTLTNMNNSDWVTGVDGYGLEFDGENDYIYLGEDIAREYEDKLTVCCWIKTDSRTHQNWGNIITENSDGNGNQITGFTLRDKVHFQGNSKNHRVEFEFEMTTTSGKEKVSLTVYNGEMDLLGWHYVAGIFNPEAQTITVGIVDEDIWAVSNLSANALPWRSLTSNITIGSIDGGGNGQGKKSGMYGTMDAVRLIADAMTPEELRMLMLYHGVKKPKLVEWKI